jgi:hypothetical protein
MFKLKLENTHHNLNEEDIQIIAKKSEGYPSSLIFNSVHEAVLEQKNKIKNATHFKKVCVSSSKNQSEISFDFLTACSHHDTEAIKMLWTDIAEDKIAITKVKPSYLLIKYILIRFFIE